MLVLLNMTSSSGDNFGLNNFFIFTQDMTHTVPLQYLTSHFILWYEANNHQNYIFISAEGLLESSSLFAPFRKMLYLDTDSIFIKYEKDKLHLL